MKDIKVVKIEFPGVELETRDGHKLRGFFGNLFKEQSNLLHNHYGDGKYRYEYPKVQYKVLSGLPILVGIEEGAELLAELFMKIDHLRIEKVKYEIYNKDIEYAQFTCGYSKELIDYRFYTNWLALNQKNFEAYKSMTHNDRRSFLQRILIGHILNFYSAVSLKLTDEERLFCKVDVTERMAKLKGNKMISFKGEFSVNAYIPEGIGLGRSVSRGFGTLKKV